MKRFIAGLILLTPAATAQQKPRKPETVMVAFRVTLRSDSALVDIFNWRDAEIPDHAPPETQSIWADMKRLTEPATASQAWNSPKSQ